METNGLRTWIEINKRAAENNYKIFRKLIAKDCRLMAVVKSNAYGHGLVDFSQLLQRLGADWFGVDSIVEAMALRKSDIKKNILVLGYTLPERLRDAAKSNVSITVSSLSHLVRLNDIRCRWEKPLKIHLKIDTGMRRQGFQLAPARLATRSVAGGELPKAVNLLKKMKNKVRVEGVYTHFAAAKNPSFPGDTLRQIKLFEEAVKILKEAGFNPIKHAAATGGTIIFPQAHYDMARIGIGLYGIWPSKETEAVFSDRIKLKPALAWKTIIGEIKNAAKGDRIGYDFTETFSKPAKIAILPVGYWHGFPRALSSIGKVIIKGKLARVLGRVSMDMIAVDISDVKNAKIGDEAIIIGESGESSISADDIADLTNTSSYEILSRLNPLIKRIYI